MFRMLTKGPDMRTIEQLREQRAALRTQMAGVIDAAQAEDRDLTEEDRAAIAQARTEFDNLGSELEARDAVQRVNLEANSLVLATAPSRPTSLGDHVINELREQLEAFGGNLPKGTSLAATEFTNAATDVQVTTGTSLQPLLTELDTTIVTQPRRRLTIADLLGQGQLAGNAITYWIEAAMEGGFTTVAENATKPQLHFLDPVAVTETLKKIAGFVKHSTEMLEDLPFLVSDINGRLLFELDLFEENQILDGNGTGTNLLGLLRRSGIQTLGSAADAKAGNLDLIYRALTNVTTATDLDADGIVIHPLDYQDFRLAKDGNDQYYAGGPFAGQYGTGAIMEKPPVWAVPTVVTPAIARGTVLVGNFRQSSTLYGKGGVRVEVTNADGNDATNNRFAVIAEKRKALAVRKPAAMVKVTLGAA